MAYTLSVVATVTQGLPLHEYTEEQLRADKDLDKAVRDALEANTGIEAHTAHALKISRRRARAAQETLAHSDLRELLDGLTQMYHSSKSGSGDAAPDIGLFSRVWRGREPVEPSEKDIRKTLQYRL